MADHGFPVPFGGINTATGSLNEGQVGRAVAHMAAGCGKGHAHNIAIQWDGWAGPGFAVIYTTKLGVECVREAISEDAG